MNAAAQLAPALPALGIIAGSGDLPRVIINACQETGRPYFLLAIEDAADAQTIEAAGQAHAKIRIGAIGKALDLLRSQRVEEIVLAGRVTRPKLSTLRPDLKGAKLLARLGGQFLSGDNELLASVVNFGGRRLPRRRCGRNRT